jgi:hypothetical protein
MPELAVTSEVGTKRAFQDFRSMLAFGGKGAPFGRIYEYTPLKQKRPQAALGAV